MGTDIPSGAPPLHRGQLTNSKGSSSEAEDVYRDSIGPIFDAGLAVVVPDADLGHGLVLEPSPGPLPGHVSLWVRSEARRTRRRVMRGTDPVGPDGWNGFAPSSSPNAPDPALSTGMQL